MESPQPQSPLPPSTPQRPRSPRIVSATPRIVSSSSEHASPIRSPTISLEQPSNKKNRSKSSKIFRRFRSVFKSFPIINPTCKIPVSLHGSRAHEVHIHGGTRITGTLFGHRKTRVNLAIQENPRSIPILVLEFAVPTGKFLQDMGTGLTRIALECEKQPSEKTKLIEELIWIMYCNGRKVGYAVKREPSNDDLGVMQTLHAVSMGAGVLPTETPDPPDGEMTYMRAQFERVVGSKDSETFYMMNPDGSSGPELSIFFVRI